MFAFMQIVVCPFSAGFASFGHWIELHPEKICVRGALHQTRVFCCPAVPVQVTVIEETRCCP